MDPGRQQQHQLLCLVLLVESAEGCGCGYECYGVRGVAQAVPSIYSFSLNQPLVLFFTYRGYRYVCVLFELLVLVLSFAVH